MWPLNTSRTEFREVNPSAPESERHCPQENPRLETESGASPGNEKIVAGNTEGKKSQDGGGCFQTTPSNLRNSRSAMRKEKEWRRTLACKLYEERHGNGYGPGEGMDRLWELHEDESNEESSNTKLQKERGWAAGDYEDDDDEVEGSEELYCLEALKISARKVNNLGLVRPNLARISRAIKGIRTLHQVATHSNKI